jgi:protease I
MEKLQQRLDGKRIAILVANGFEQVELTEPRTALMAAGAATDLVSPEAGTVRAFQHDKPGDEFLVDVALKAADSSKYDGLLLPGGVANPDTLRITPEAIEFIKAFVDSGKPIAAICHGPWPLIEAGAVHERTMTSWPSLQSDLRNAGANWVNREVVVDNGLVTSRKPADIPAFNQKMIEEFAEGVHGPHLTKSEDSAKKTGEEPTRLAHTGVAQAISQSQGDEGQTQSTGQEQPAGV